MIDRTHRLRQALPLLGMSLLLLGALGPRQGKTVNLAGTWKLDLEKTAEEQKGEPADPRSKQGYNSGAGRPRVGTGVTEPRGGGGMGGAPGASAAGRANLASLGALGAYARPQQELVIVQTDSTISISDPRGTPRSYRPNGAKEIEPLLGVDSLEVVARWKGGKLTTERKFGQLGSIREVYAIDSDNVMVEVRVSAPQLPQPLDLRRVYARATGS